MSARKGRGRGPSARFAAGRMGLFHFVGATLAVARSTGCGFFVGTDVLICPPCQGTKPCTGCRGFRLRAGRGDGDVSPAGEFLLQRCKRNQKTAGVGTRSPPDWSFLRRGDFKGGREIEIPPTFDSSLVTFCLHRKSLARGRNTPSPVPPAGGVPRPAGRNSQSPPAGETPASPFPFQRILSAPASTNGPDCKPRVNLVILHSNCSACGGTPQFLIPNS